MLSCSKCYQIIGPTAMNCSRRSTQITSTSRPPSHYLFFFFNDRAPPEISPLPLPAALPIVVGFAARVTPTQQSVLAQPTGVEARRPPERVTTREVIVRRQPAAAPVPFAAREQALAAHPGRPLDHTTMRALRTSTPNATARPFVRPAIEEQRGQAPAPALRPVREGLPPSRSEE